MSSATEDLGNGDENPMLSPIVDFTEFLQFQCGTPASQSPEPTLESDLIEPGSRPTYDEPLTLDLAKIESAHIMPHIGVPQTPDLSLGEPLPNGTAGAEGDAISGLAVGPQALSYGNQLPFNVAGEVLMPMLDPTSWPLVSPVEVALQTTKTELEKVTKKKESWKQKAHAERERRVRSEHQLDQIRHVICSASPAQRLPPTPRRTPVTPKRSIDTMTNDLSLSVPQMVRLTDPLSDGPLPIRGRRLTFSSPITREAGGSSSPAETVRLTTPSPSQKKRRGRPTATPATPTPRRSRRKITDQPEAKRKKTD